MKNINLAVTRVLKERKYLLVFLFSSIAFFALFVVIPLAAVPGNDLAFQLKIFRARDYLLMAFIALLAGLNLAFQVYSLKQQRARGFVQSAAGGVIPGVVGIFGAVVGTAACASCLAALFGETPRLYSRGLSSDGVPWSGTPHRKPFIHGFTPMAFWCAGKQGLRFVLKLR